jgi:hypothetical protein
VVGVGIREEQVQLPLLKLGGQGLQLAGELARELRIARRQLVQLDQVGRAPLQALPGLDLPACVGSLPRRAPSLDRIVPDAGLG